MEYNAMLKMSTIDLKDSGPHWRYLTENKANQ